MLIFYNFRQDYLKFEGSDRLDLINRLSTNQVNTLQKFKGIKTVLTSDKGRFIDLLTLYNFGDFIFVSCSFNNAANVKSHIEKYTIMDDFMSVNMAGTHESILLFGDKTNDYIKEVFNIDTENYVNNDFEIYVEENNHSIIARNDDKFGGCIFIYDVKNSGFWKDKMLNETLKSRYKILEIDDKQFEQRRIELGIPAFGKEMTELTNPLECGIEKYISFTKGCYIGQEVIARLDTYDKINKHLVSIEAEKEFTAADTKILTDSKECGIVTSAVKNAGLGFVKTIFLDFNRIYQLKQNDIMINCKLKQIK